jgi:hypothetical protein
MLPRTFLSIAPLPLCLSGQSLQDDDITVLTLERRAIA